LLLGHINHTKESKLSKLKKATHGKAAYRKRFNLLPGKGSGGLPWSRNHMCHLEKKKKAPQNSGARTAKRKQALSEGETSWMEPDVRSGGANEVKRGPCVLGMG